MDDATKKWLDTHCCLCGYLLCLDSIVSGNCLGCGSDLGRQRLVTASGIVCPDSTDATYEAEWEAFLLLNTPRKILVSAQNDVGWSDYTALLACLSFIAEDKDRMAAFSNYINGRVNDELAFEADEEYEDLAFDDDDFNDDHGKGY